MPPVTRRQILAGTAGAAGLSLLPLLSACTSDPAPGGDSRDATSEEKAALPATVEHRYGSTTISEPPQRVVTVGLTDHDALIAVGVIPVGVTSWYGSADGQIFPWAAEAFGDNELPAVLSELEYERIAALQPDLIIGQYTGMTDRQYRLLSAIAPTVAQSADHPDWGTPWDVMAMTIATAVGRPEQMRAVIDDVRTQIASAGRQHPEFEGKDAAVVMPYEGLYVLGPADPKTQLLTDLGFDYPADTFPYADGEEAGVQFSGEDVPDLDELDLVMWLSLEPDSATATVFDETQVAREGRYLNVVEEDGSTFGVAISYYTPLSIPYVLDRLVPQLAAAIDGDPATVPPTPTD